MFGSHSFPYDMKSHDPEARLAQPVLSLVIPLVPREAIVSLCSVQSASGQHEDKVIENRAGWRDMAAVS